METGDLDGRPFLFGAWSWGTASRRAGDARAKNVFAEPAAGGLIQAVCGTMVALDQGVEKGIGNRHQTDIKPTWKRR
jgi:hypothetical protein